MNTNKIYPTGALNRRRRFGQVVPCVCKYRRTSRRHNNYLFDLTIAFLLYNAPACNAQRSVSISNTSRALTMTMMQSVFHHAGGRLPLFVLLLLSTSTVSLGVARKTAATSVDIDLNTVVNVVSNEFVSFAIDPVQLLAMRERPQ